MPIDDPASGIDEAAAGAAAGSAFGPWGTAIGAGAGYLVGLLMPGADSAQPMPSYGPGMTAFPPYWAPTDTGAIGGLIETGSYDEQVQNMDPATFAWWLSQGFGPSFGLSEEESKRMLDQYTMEQAIAGGATAEDLGMSNAEFAAMRMGGGVVDAIGGGGGPTLEEFMAANPTASVTRPQYDEYGDVYGKGLNQLGEQLLQQPALLDYSTDYKDADLWGNTAWSAGAYGNQMQNVAASRNQMANALNEQYGNIGYLTDVIEGNAPSVAVLERQRAMDQAQRQALSMAASSGDPGAWRAAIDAGAMAENQAAMDAATLRAQEIAQATDARTGALQNLASTAGALSDQEARLLEEAGINTGRSIGLDTTQNQMNYDQWRAYLDDWATRMNEWNAIQGLGLDYLGGGADNRVAVTGINQAGTAAAQGASAGTAGAAANVYGTNADLYSQANEQARADADKWNDVFSTSLGVVANNIGSNNPSGGGGANQVGGRPPANYTPQQQTSDQGTVNPNTPQAGGIRDANGNPIYR